jgi:hypothetical protein
MRPYGAAKRRHRHSLNLKTPKSAAVAGIVFSLLRSALRMAIEGRLKWLGIF